MDQEKSLDIKYYIRLLRKRIWFVIGFILLCGIGTALVSIYLLNPVYEASTKLIVNKSEDSTMYQQIDLNTVNANIKLIDTYKEIIKSPAIMDIVVRENPKFGLTSSQLIGKVRVNSVNNTQVMTVSITDYSHRKAVEMVNAISKVFQQEIPTLMKVDNVFLLNKAQFEKRPNPISTSPTFNVAISLLLSFLLVSIIIFLLDYFDDTIKTEEDVTKYLMLPTLSMIPRTNADDLQPKSSRTRTETGEPTNVSTNRTI